MFPIDFQNRRNVLAWKSFLESWDLTLWRVFWVCRSLWHTKAILTIALQNWEIALSSNHDWPYIFSQTKYYWLSLQTTQWQQASSSVWDSSFCSAKTVPFLFFFLLATLRWRCSCYRTTASIFLSFIFLEFGFRLVWFYATCFIDFLVKNF